MYQILSTHLKTCLATGADDRWTGGLPAYVVRDLRAYLGCGILAHGFTRFFCLECHSDVLAPFVRAVKLPA